MTMDPAFDYDSFHLREAAYGGLTRYVVTDEQGAALLVAERPAAGGRVIPFVCSMLAGVVIAACFLSVADSMAAAVARAAFLVVAPLAGAVVAVLAYARLAPRRRLILRHAETGGKPFLDVRQNVSQALLSSTWAVKDGAGRLVGTLRQYPLRDVVHTRWELFGPDGHFVAAACEVGVGRAVLRRLVGGRNGAFRTDFTLVEAESGRALLEVRRRTALPERGVVRVRDPKRRLDRRLAVAAVVLLDSGAGRRPPRSLPS